MWMFVWVFAWSVLLIVSILYWTYVLERFIGRMLYNGTHTHTHTHTHSSADSGTHVVEHIECNANIGKHIVECLHWKICVWSVLVERTHMSLFVSGTHTVERIAERSTRNARHTLEGILWYAPIGLHIMACAHSKVCNAYSGTRRIEPRKWNVYNRRNAVQSRKRNIDGTLPERRQKVVRVFIAFGGQEQTRPNDALYTNWNYECSTGGFESIWWNDWEAHRR